MGIVIISTYPDKNSLSKVANLVVKQQLAACVNYTEINSIYTWKGKIENTEEFLAFFKTTTKTKQKLKKECTRIPFLVSVRSSGYRNRSLILDQLVPVLPMGFVTIVFLLRVAGAAFWAVLRESVGITGVWAKEQTATIRTTQARMNTFFIVEISCRNCKIQL